MDKDKLISGIYNGTINDILSGIEEKYKNEICQAYVDYLKKNYLNVDLHFENRKTDELINLFVELEKSKWRDAGSELKLSELLNDPAYENIKYISNTGYKYAKKRLDKKFAAGVELLALPAVIDEEKTQDGINMLHNYYEQVRDFNKNIANYYVSEGTLDFQYACGVTDNMSLRIGRLRR